MKRKSLYATLLCLAVVAILAMAATAIAQVGGEEPMIGADRSSDFGQGRHVPRTALVQFRHGVTRAEAKAVALRAGGHVAREIRRTYHCGHRSPAGSHW